MTSSFKRVVAILAAASTIVSCEPGKKDNTKTEASDTGTANNEAQKAVAAEEDKQDKQIIADEYIMTYSPELKKAFMAYQANQVGAQRPKNAYIDKTLGSAFLQLDDKYKIIGITRVCVIVKVKTNKDINAIKATLVSKGIVDVEHNYTVKVFLPEMRKVNVTAEEIPWGVVRVSNSSKPNGTYKRAWVLDTGVDPAHEDLNVDVGKSKSFVNGESVTDVLNHGTHVAGIIGAKANGKGVVGVAPNAPICAVKVINRMNRLNFGEYLKGLDYVLTECKTGEVVNLSLVRGFGKDQNETDLITGIAAKGTFVCIAAGNASNMPSGKREDIDTYTFSGKTGVCPAVINGAKIYTVSAFDKTGTYASFSNYGRSADYSLPGVDINSCVPGSYGTMSGTSMAAPHLAGLLLLKPSVKTDGQVKGDPDGIPDPIAHE